MLILYILVCLLWATITFLLNRQRTAVKQLNLEVITFILDAALMPLSMCLAIGKLYLQNKGLHL